MKTRKTDITWRALADPTRRRILDALRVRPQTTGELCLPFKLSRFAVMKHLSILVSAGLVLVRRQGRERWNYLNAVPIQEIYERWVRPYEAVWAKNLLNLRDHLEPIEETQAMNHSSFGVALVELEITIHAKPSRVWSALVTETSLWWNKDFYTSSAARGFIIEPKLGGRVFEDWGDGAGQIWYTVIGLAPLKSIMLQGLLSPAFGGPAHSLLEIQLEGSGKNTRLKISDTIFGKVGDDKKSQTREGWRVLFEDGLKAFAEKNAQ